MQAYSSVYGICGATLAALAAEPIAEFATYHFASIYSADTLQLPAGVTVCAVCANHETYAELCKVAKEGDVISAYTPFFPMPY